MGRLKFTIPVALFLSTAPAVMHAQSGCADSPENPTVIFGLIAAAASLGIARFRGRK
jgi:XrtJ-associated TM-motif-TM protein